MYYTQFKDVQEWEKKNVDFSKKNKKLAVILE